MQGFVYPEYRSRSIVEVPNTILKVFGFPGYRALDESIITRNFEDINNVVLFIIDGLGNKLYTQLQKQDSLAGFGKLHHNYITSVFPSTTAAALTSFASGKPPSEHGILGFRIFLEDSFDTLNTIFYYVEGHRECAPHIEPDDLKPTFYIYEPLMREGFKVYSLLKREYIGSPFTKIIYGLQEPIAHDNIVDLIIDAADILKNNPGDKKFLSLYTADVDSISHMYGPFSSQVMAYIKNLDSLLLQYLLPAINFDNTLLIITADHGHIETDETNSINLFEDQYVMKQITQYPAGESRTMYFKVKNEKEFLEHLIEKYNDKAEFYLSGDAIQKGIFGGDVENHFKNRLGDVVAIAKDSFYFTYERERHIRPFVTGKIGKHGGMSLDEMLVPLLWK